MDYKKAGVDIEAGYQSVELMKNSDMSISEIAFAVGFRDAGYFGKCFRKKYNQTPREYMNECRRI